MNTAAKVAQRKRNRPELYCPAPRCLWLTGDGSFCPRHAPKPVTAPQTCENMIRDYQDVTGENANKCGALADFVINGLDLCRSCEKGE